MEPEPGTLSPYAEGKINMQRPKVATSMNALKSISTAIPNSQAPDGRDAYMRKRPERTKPERMQADTQERKRLQSKASY